MANFLVKRPFCHYRRFPTTFSFFLCIVLKVVLVLLPMVLRRYQMTMGISHASLVGLLFGGSGSSGPDYHENTNAATITLLSIRGNCLKQDKPIKQPFSIFLLHGTFFCMSDVSLILFTFNIMSSFCWIWKNLHIYLYFFRGCWHTQLLGDLNHYAVYPFFVQDT